MTLRRHRFSGCVFSQQVFVQLALRPHIAHVSIFVLVRLHQESGHPTLKDTAPKARAPKKWRRTRFSCVGLVKASQKLAPDRVPRVVPDTVLVRQKSGAGHGPGLLRGPYKRLLKSDAGQGPKRNGPGGGAQFSKSGRSRRYQNSRISAVIPGLRPDHCRVLINANVCSDPGK